MQGSFGYFTPFVEAKTVRTTPTVMTQTGSNLSAIEHVLQGISVVTERQKYSGMLPKLGTGRLDGQIEITTFGQSKEFNENEKFEELLRFNPVTYIENPNTLIFPAVLGNASLEDPERFGGFIEPLTIDSRELLKSLQALDDDPHRIRGHIQDGNEDSFTKTSKIVQFIDNFDDSLPDDLYIDSTSHIGSLGGDILIPGYFPESEKKIAPFDETITQGKVFIPGSIAGSSTGDIESAIIAMTNSATDDIPGIDYKSMGAGFTYSNNPAGTDSIAYGGLKR